MADISDETLMAYVDGDLSADKRARLARQIASDRKLARRLAQFEQTSAKSLAPAFEPVLRAPVPERLLHAVSSSVSSPAPATKSMERWRSGLVSGTSLRIFEGVRALLPKGSSPFAAALALAAAVVLLAGGAVMLARQMPEGDPFRIALETVPSGSSVAFKTADGQRSVAPELSFQSRDGRYCRKYMVTRADQSRLAGVACRDDGGGWRIDFEADGGRAPQGGQHVTAGAAGAAGLDDRIGDMITGAAFGRTEEDELLKEGWK